MLHRRGLLEGQPEPTTFLMTSPSANLFHSALGPEGGTAYRLSRAVRERFPSKAIVEGLEGFDLDEFAGAKRCEARALTEPHAHLDTNWSRSHGLTTSTETAMFEVRWREHTLTVVRATWPEGYSHPSSYWVIADEREVAEQFASEVSAFCNDPRETVLTFRGGCWSKNAELYKQIYAASFDELILAGNMKDAIKDDFAAFLAAKESYARYGVPWKRGVLFVGPPGNGKTHTLRATIKFVGVPCLYVQSLKSRYETDDANIARVFDRAREITPCCLVFEDLDAMITSENRSVFLNQLDGFANASGLLTLATTNHPERLDPSILERPSRFDRKYHFAMPAAAERTQYASAWNVRLDPAMRVADAELATLAADSDGFSFAYLKELFLSSMIRWMKEQKPGSMPEILRTQLVTLREQMRADVVPVAPLHHVPGPHEDD
ncbi:MAG: ATPase, central domain protein [Myxococcaceae bacterium]|nr:ATPase, central domain protein [Myxococcaceae bacterium]